LEIVGRKGRNNQKQSLVAQVQSPLKEVTSTTTSHFQVVCGIGEGSSDEFATIHGTGDKGVGTFQNIPHSRLTHKPL
jgi:hypothetical protein